MCAYGVLRKVNRSEWGFPAFTIPKKDGTFEDRGGFWAPVELWHKDTERWQALYQKGMRVLVVGRMEREPWTDNEDQPRETWQINARSVGILPFRIESVTLSPRHQETAQDTQPKPQATQEPTAPKEPKRRK